MYICLPELVRVEFSYVGPTTTFTAHISGFGRGSEWGVPRRDPRDLGAGTAQIGGLNAIVHNFFSTSSWNYPGPGPCGSGVACNNPVSGAFDLSPVSVFLTLSLSGSCTFNSFFPCDDFQLPSLFVVTINTNAGELFLGPAPYPVPATLPLFATGLGALGLLGGAGSGRLSSRAELV